MSYNRTASTRGFLPESSTVYRVCCAVCGRPGQEYLGVLPDGWVRRGEHGRLALCSAGCAYQFDSAHAKGGEGAVIHTPPD